MPMLTLRRQLYNPSSRVKPLFSTTVAAFNSRLHSPDETLGHNDLRNRFFYSEVKRFPGLICKQHVLANCINSFGPTLVIHAYLLHSERQTFKLFAVKTKVTNISQHQKSKKDIFTVILTARSIRP